MGIAYQPTVEYADFRPAPQRDAVRRRAMRQPETLRAEEPDLRRLGQLICAASCLFSSWMLWTLGSFIVG